MSVRRLAKLQPESFAFTPEWKKKADWWIAKYPEGRQRSAVIPLLWLSTEAGGLGLRARHPRGGPRFWTSR